MLSENRPGLGKKPGAVTAVEKFLSFTGKQIMQRRLPGPGYLMVRPQSLHGHLAQLHPVPCFQRVQPHPGQLLFRQLQRGYRALMAIKAYLSPGLPQESIQRLKAEMIPVAVRQYNRLQPG